MRHLPGRQQLAQQRQPGLRLTHTGRLRRRFASPDPTPDYLDGSARYDLIVDIGGRNRIRRLRRALAATGTLVVERQVQALGLSLVVGQRLTGFVNKEHHTILERLAVHLASGAVVPVIDRTVDLEHVPDAIRDLTAGRIAGMAAVVIRSG